MIEWLHKYFRALLITGSPRIAWTCGKPYLLAASPVAKTLWNAWRKLR